MFDELGTIRNQFTAHDTLDGRIDQVFEAMKSIGFEALIYDYTPVPAISTARSWSRRC